MNKKTSWRIIALVAFGAIATATLVACGDFDEKDVYADSQFVTCIYDHEDGQLIKSLAPGGGRERVEDDAEVWRVPASQRFYNIDPDPNIKDPGAPDYVVGVEAGYREVRMPVHAEFYINQALACEFLEKHGMRNVQPAVMEDSSIEDKMGFNVRGDASQPWFVFLNEKFGQALLREGEPLLFQFAWPYYEYNFPINADLNGVLPCLDEAQVVEEEPADEEESTDEVAEVPAVDQIVQCENYATPEPIARDIVEEKLSPVFTEALKAQLSGKNYFCGPGYDPDQPEKCPPISIIIPRIELVDQSPVADRQAIIDLRQKALNDAEEAILTEQSTTAAVAKRNAEISQENQIAELEATDRIADAARVKRIQDAEAANNAATADQKARELLAPCVVREATVSECALLLATLNGQYPQGNNGGQVVTINPVSPTATTQPPAANPEPTPTTTVPPAPEG